MAAKYRKIDPRIWNDEVFDQLSPSEKLCTLWLLSSNAVNRAGVAVFRIGEGGDYWHCETYDHAWDLLVSVCAKFAWPVQKLGRSNCIVIFPKWFRYNPPNNLKHLKGMLSDLADVPKCDILDTVYPTLKHYLPRVFHEQFNVYIYTVWGSASDTVSREIASFSRYQEQETETETETAQQEGREQSPQAAKPVPDWSRVVSSLKDLDVGGVDALIADIRRNRWTPDCAAAVVDHYRTLRGVSPGALYKRLRDFQPDDLPVAKGWPKPAPGTSRAKPRPDPAYRAELRRYAYRQQLRNNQDAPLTGDALLDAMEKYDSEVRVAPAATD